MNLSSDPVPYIPNIVAETLAIPEAAQKDGDIKAVVLTPSSMAGVPWGVTGRISEDAYNQEYIDLAWNKESLHPLKTTAVYAAAKAQAEQAAWRYAAENKPPKALCDGDLKLIGNIPAHNFIDVSDDAKLRLAGLTDPSTENERLIFSEKGFIDGLEGIATDSSVPPTESALNALKNVYGITEWTSLETSLKDSRFERTLVK
ncbi:uncharacterized protein PV09_03310 [Verruconis gallopava]|uniref:Uncharacterized protein n=1 Tax=Verruconis gallopava TaxID=253628 RepID=A0A0D2AGV4_9PEZI|nr:uncharacterized protein PV09_03310 [Verruconis gallopava]KIW06148.1 hypothetical protein PV09_03310 [Verruconis gallopava]